MDAIVVALITGGLSLIGVIITNRAGQRRARTEDGHRAPTPEDTTPNRAGQQRITIGRISSGDRATIRALCEGLGLIPAGLYP